MKKLAYVLAVFVLAAVSGMIFGQGVDLVGTWEGATEVPNAIEPDGLTLVIANENGEYSGRITDTIGMINNAECRDFVFVDNKLSFNFTADTGEEYLGVNVTFKVDGDTMIGFWETDDGETGAIELKKK